MDGSGGLGARASLRTPNDPQRECLEYFHALYSAMTDEEFEAELREEQATMSEGEPAHVHVGCRLVGWARVHDGEPYGGPVVTCATALRR